MLLEVSPAEAPLLKSMLIDPATLCARFANVATPLTTVAVKVPCKAPEPLPALREAVTTEELSEARKLPN